MFATACVTDWSVIITGGETICFIHRTGERETDTGTQSPLDCDILSLVLWLMQRRMGQQIVVSLSVPLNWRSFATNGGMWML